TMPQPPLERQLAALEATRYRFNAGDGAQVEKLLPALDKVRFPDAASLIRFHEALMFLRAFPHSPAVLRATERILNQFHEKVAALRQSGVDMEAFDPLEVSGIAGTQMEDTLSFDVARWLVGRMPGQVEIAWDNYEPARELGTTGPRFIPLLEDDAFVEADTPFRRWLETASGSGTKKRSGYSQLPAWLIDRFDRLPLPPLQKAELYESLRIPLRWNLANSRLTRTRNWRPARKVYYHDGPLPRTLRHHTRRPALGSARRTWKERSRPRRRNLSLEPLAQPPPPAARLRRRIHAEEWHAHQLHRGHRTVRVDG